MKYTKYLIFSLVLLLQFSCEKHEILYNTRPVGQNDAEFQLHYFEPINNTAEHYIDSVYINNVLYSSVEGSGQLLPYNGIPGGATGRFFAVKSGDTNIKFYRDSQVVYNQNISLLAGKQNVFVHDLTKAPIVIDNKYPYKKNSIPSTIVNWGTDSIAHVRFYNFLYEKDGSVYDKAIQYQYKDARTKEWTNLGAAVEFGEATDWVTVKVIKEVLISSGKCKIYYRMLDENGDPLKIMKTNGSFVDYGDWWNAYIGRAYMHIFSGNRAKKPTAAVKVWTSL